MEYVLYINILKIKEIKEEHLKLIKIKLLVEFNFLLSYNPLNQEKILCLKDYILLQVKDDLNH